MSPAPLRGRFSLIWIIILVTGVFHSPVNAQEGYQARLAPANTEGFPEISSYLDVRSSTGEFVHGLEQHNVYLLENGTQLPVQELQQIRTGVQVVVAISPGQAFDIRDVQGISRYDYLAQALQDWALTRQGSTVDDLSLIVSDGPEVTHIDAYERWAESLNSFEPTGEETGPDFDVLTRALDVAADPNPNPGTSGAVLFVTPLPSQDLSLGMQSLAARANQQGVKIFIWLVASSEQFANPEADQMRQLAEQTGGELFAYSGQETIPSPEEFLENLRDTYMLSYDSQITSSGLHEISAEVNYQGQKITSPVQEIELEILPASITFVSPPIEIERIRSEQEGDPVDITPDTQPLDLLIEFPDGHPRPIVKTSLYVDGILEEVNLAEPFDRFIWDISGFTTNGEHSLVLEVEDNLGLIGRSVETSISVNVIGADESIWIRISENRLALTVILVAASGAIILLVLVLGGRLQPGFLREWRRRRKTTGSMTQPVVDNRQVVQQSRSSWINRIQWKRSPITTKPSAQFIQLTDSLSDENQSPIAIIKDRVIIGRDEMKVDQVLRDLSVEGVHAHLEREPGGSFRLSDEGSTAGTWVNYQPVPESGKILEHGDLVHFGRMGYRFVLRNPKQVRKPVLRYLNQA